MKIRRLRWIFPAIAFLLFAFGLAVMVATPAMPQQPAAALAGIDAALAQVGQLSDDFTDLGGGQRHSVAALSEHARRVRLQLRDLGALPGQEEVSVSLTQHFDAAFRKAMQARLALVDTPDDPAALLASTQPFFDTLQSDLQQARLAAQGRWFDSAAAGLEGIGDALALITVVTALVAAALALLLWGSVPALMRRGRGRRAAG